MRNFLLTQLAIGCVLSLTPLFADELQTLEMQPLDTERAFALLEKKEAKVLSPNLGVSIGPLALLHDQVYFSQKSVDSPPCLGRDVYRFSLKQPAAPAKKVAEISCVLDIAPVSATAVAVRSWEGTEPTVRVRLIGETEDTEWISPLTQDAEAESEFWLSLFDLNADFIDGSFLQRYPTNVHGWEILWTTSATKKITSVAAAQAKNKFFHAVQTSLLTPAERASALLTRNGSHLFAISQLKNLASFPLQDASGEPAVAGEAAEHAIFEPGAIVAAKDWGARELITIRPSDRSNSLWLLEQSRDSESTAALWWHDPTSATFISVPGIAAGEISGITTLTNGLLVGTYFGTLKWIRTPSAPSAEILTTTAQRAIPVAAPCRFSMAKLNTARGEEWIWGYEDEMGFHQILQTPPLEGSQWLCRGDNLVLLAKHYRFHWAKSQVQLDVSADVPGETLATNVTQILDWQLKLKDTQLLFSEQDGFAASTARPTLLVFSKTLLKKARTSFGAKEFSSLLSSPEDNANVFIRLQPQGGDRPEAEYQLQMRWDGSQLKGSSL